MDSDPAAEAQSVTAPGASAPAASDESRGQPSAGPEGPGGQPSEGMRGGIIADEASDPGDGPLASAGSPPADGEEEEASAPRLPRQPTDPTEEERRLHEVTHLPFRSWCRFCVFGRLDRLPHPSEVGGEHLVPEFSMDYCSIAKEGFPGSLTVLLGKDRKLQDTHGQRRHV